VTPAFGTFATSSGDPNLVAQASGVGVRADRTDRRPGTRRDAQLVADVRKVPAQPINQSVIAGTLGRPLPRRGEEGGPDLTVGKLIGAANARFSYHAGWPGPRVPGGHDRPAVWFSRAQQRDLLQIAAAYPAAGSSGSVSRGHARAGDAFAGVLAVLVIIGRLPVRTMSTTTASPRPPPRCPPVRSPPTSRRRIVADLPGCAGPR
jgi:hypothetical protein